MGEAPLPIPSASSLFVTCNHVRHGTERQNAHRFGRRFVSLYGTVVVPQQVIAELKDSAAPPEVRRWASSLPDWIDVRAAVVSDDDMTHLDLGERAAIALAQSEPGALLLIDETAGRIEASRRGIKNTGTLGVLRAAALKDYLDLPTALARLLETNFRVSMAGERSAR